MSFIRENDNLPLPQNFASHDSNEFPIRRTGNDNVATTLEDRQVEVRRWVQSEPFRALLAA